MWSAHVLARLRSRAVGWSFRAASHAVAEYLAGVSAVDPGFRCIPFTGAACECFELWSTVSDEPFDVWIIATLQRGFLAVDTRFEKACQAVEVTVLFDETDFGHESLGVDQFLKGNVVQIQLS